MRPHRLHGGSARGRGRRWYDDEDYGRDYVLRGRRMRGYGREFRRRRGRRRDRSQRRGYARVFGRWMRTPGRPARGFPVRGVHTYDLDYGRQAGGPDTDYSGRAGYPVPEPTWEPPLRGPYTPSLEEERRRRRFVRPPSGRRRRRPPRHWSTEEAPGRRR